MKGRRLEEFYSVTDLKKNMKIKTNTSSIDVCPYKVDVPYPPIQVDSKNSVYACDMLGNMSEVVSEMSDVSRYFYIAVVAKPQSSWISSCFHHISIIEMHHLNIFAELALLLGADPRLWSCNEYSQWWSPSFVGYPRGLRALVEESIRAEEAAIAKYSNQADIIRDENIVAILKRIVLDEERHLQIFTEMYHQL